MTSQISARACPTLLGTAPLRAARNCEVDEGSKLGASGNRKGWASRGKTCRGPAAARLLPTLQETRLPHTASDARRGQERALGRWWRTSCAASARRAAARHTIAAGCGPSKRRMAASSHTTRRRRRRRSLRRRCAALGSRAEQNSLSDLPAVLQRVCAALWWRLAPLEACAGELKLQKAPQNVQSITWSSTCLSLACKVWLVVLHIALALQG